MMIPFESILQISGMALYLGSDHSLSGIAETSSLQDSYFSTDFCIMTSKNSIIGAKELIERFPFGVIFSKTAPSNCNEADYKIDYNEDFRYFYFSPGLEKRSALRRAQMLTGDVNAKRDFPVDFEQYFLDDCEVVQQCTNGKVKAFTEPWEPPGVVGDVHFVYTRKTALESEDSLFMLGTFEVINDTVLGRDSSPIVIEYDATSLLTSFPTSDAISAQWYSDAFAALPIGLALASLDGSILSTNLWWDQLAPSDALVGELRQVTTSTATPLTTARWLQCSEELGRGVYHILNPDDQQVYAVYVLRPAMRTHADPYYIDGKLVAR